MPLLPQQEALRGQPIDVGRENAVRFVGGQFRPEVVDRDEEDIHRLRRSAGMRGRDPQDQT